MTKNHTWESYWYRKGWEISEGKNRKAIWWANFGHVKWYLDILLFENSEKKSQSGGDLSTCDVKRRKEDWG